MEIILDIINAVPLYVDEGNILDESFVLDNEKKCAYKTPINYKEAIKGELYDLKINKRSDGSLWVKKSELLGWFEHKQKNSNFIYELQEPFISHVQECFMQKGIANKGLFIRKVGRKLFEIMKHLKIEPKISLAINCFFVLFDLTDRKGDKIYNPQGKRQEPGFTYDNIRLYLRKTFTICKQGRISKGKMVKQKQNIQSICNSFSQNENEQLQMEFKKLTS